MHNNFYPQTNVYNFKQHTRARGKNPCTTVPPRFEFGRVVDSINAKNKISDIAETFCAMSKTNLTADELTRVRVSSVIFFFFSRRASLFRAA